MSSGIIPTKMNWGIITFHERGIPFWKATSIIHGTMLRVFPLFIWIFRDFFPCLMVVAMCQAHGGQGSRPECGCGLTSARLSTSNVEAPGEAPWSDPSDPSDPGWKTLGFEVCCVSRGGTPPIVHNLILKWYPPN